MSSFQANQLASGYHFMSEVCGQQSDPYLFNLEYITP